MCDVKFVDFFVVVKYFFSRFVLYLRFYVRVIIEFFLFFCVKIKFCNIIEEMVFWRIIFFWIFIGGYVKSVLFIFSVVYYIEMFFRDGVVFVWY